MTDINLSGVLLANGGSPKFASNQAAGLRTLYPLKFTPDVIYNGQGTIGSEAFAGTNTYVQKNGKIAEGLTAYEFNIAQGVDYAWGAAHTFSNKPKGTVINIQFSIFFPTDFDWTASGGGRLKFPRVHTSCADFSYFKFDTGTGTVPANGTVISKGGWSATFVGLTSGQDIDTVSTPITAGQAMPSIGYIRVTGATGTLTNGALTGIGANASGSVSYNEGWNDIYILNTTYAGASKDGLLTHITEPSGGYNVGNFTDSTVKLIKGQWETLEGRIVLDNVAMSNGGTARTQWWILRGGVWLPVVDIQNESTLNRTTSVADSFVLFSFWNGGAPKTQKMYMDRLELHFNPATLVDTDPTSGVKMIGGIAP